MTPLLIQVAKIAEIVARRATRAGAAMILAAAIAVAGAACTSAPVSKTRALDSRLAWPCDRLVVEWAVDAEHAQQLVGQSLRVRTTDGAGRLRLQVMRCEPSAPAAPAAQDSQPLSFAYVLVPVAGEDAPIRITGIPADGWLSLRHVVASADSQALFADLGHEIIVAAQDFTIHESNGGTSISVQLAFDNGLISIDANSTVSPSARIASSAYFGLGDGFFSAYFGEENSVRQAASATVRIVGETPLSPFDLAESPAMAAFDRRLVSDRVYWRIPR